MIHIIHQKDYPTATWQGGITREIYIFPAESCLSLRNFDIRISSAIIHSTSGTFSDFSGFQRCLLPVEGEIQLFMNDEKVVLDNKQPYFFDGGIQVCSENTAEAIDFNVIFKNTQKVEVTVESNGHIKAANALYLLFALDELKIKDTIINKYDSVLIDESCNFMGKAIIVQLPKNDLFTSTPQK